MDISDDSNQLTIELVSKCLRSLMTLHSRRKIFSAEEICEHFEKNGSRFSLVEVQQVLDHNDTFSKKKKGYSLLGRKITKISLKSHSTPMQGRKKKKSSYLWCHQCKQKHDSVYYCSLFASGGCSKKYCKGCIERHYYEKVEDIDVNSWVCMFCRGICTCAFCRRKRGEHNLISNKIDRKRAHSEPQKVCKQEITVVSTEGNLFSREKKPKTKLSLSNPAVGIRRQKLQLKDFLDKGFLSPGDVLSLGYSNRYTGVLLASGEIKLEWCNALVNNLDDFIRAANTTSFYLDPWNSIVCKGQKLIHYRNALFLGEGQYKNLSPPPRKPSFSSDAMEVDDPLEFENDQLSMFYGHRLDFNV